ncbi:MAG: hypothetical protein KJZ93_30915 [Caldilineaceae bacterium]|nr:hypothetical protein [Caldilineaceae bacterium]
MATKKIEAAKQPVQPKGRRFLVEGELRSVSFGEEVYPVVDGLVELPKLPADKCWYADLVQAGILVEE